jgi:DNA primase
MSEEILPKGFTLFPTSLTQTVRNGTLTNLLSILLSSRGLDYSVCQGWGYTEQALSLRNRVIIPIEEGGEIVCWVARTLDGADLKELSPPVSVSNRSHYVYGLDSIEEGTKIAIVEGIFDCLKLKSYGYNAVSSMGAHISHEQVGKILAKNPSEIYIMFDGDEAGKDGAKDAFNKFFERAGMGYYWKIKIAQVPAGKDPDNLSKDEVSWILRF